MLTFQMLILKLCLLNHYTVIDTNNDGEISVAEAESVTGGLNVDNKNIVDLTGIEAFVNLTHLGCDNNQLKSLDVSRNKALEYLWCSRNQLTSLDVSQNSVLIQLHCYDNQLTSLDVSHNNLLERLYCEM